VNWPLAIGAAIGAAYLASKTDAGQTAVNTVVDEAGNVIGTVSDTVADTVDRATGGDATMHLDANTLATAADISRTFAASIVDAMNAAADFARINTPKRWAMWIAQTGHESNGFRSLEEGLGYSRATLLRIWPKHFDEGNVDSYVGSPELIANRAYANRMGNGDEASGDGYAYRGRGWIQLTGRDNYTAASDALGVDFVGNPDAAAALPGAALVSAWFWDANHLNVAADAGDVKKATQIINNGVIGLDDRKARYTAAADALGLTPIA
jgi:putative chitinase